MTSITSSGNPRKPNDWELNDLIEFTAREYEFSSSPVENKAEAEATVANAFIAIFDDYCTGGVGWAGKLMVVVWDGSPGQYEAYRWNNGKLIRQIKE